MSSELRRAGIKVIKEWEVGSFVVTDNEAIQSLRMLRTALSAPDELASAKAVALAAGNQAIEATSELYLLRAESREIIGTLIGMADPYGVCTTVKHPVQQARDFLKRTEGR